MAREARKLRKQTGDNRYRARVEDEISSLRDLVLVSCTRPICARSNLKIVKQLDVDQHLYPSDLLFTEPVVTSFSVSINLLRDVFFKRISFMAAMGRLRVSALSLH